MSIIEALHAGLPWVVTRVGGNPERIQDGENGFLVDIGDETGLTRAIQQVVANDFLRGSMRRHATAMAAANFSIDVCAERYLHLYRELGVTPQENSPFVPHLR